MENGLKIRIGYGWDLHRLKEGRTLVLGGTEIPSPFGEDGHSDGDVLTHAVIDALFGALALGDVGTFFPPSDPQWKDVKSTHLLSKTLEMIHEREYRVENVDTTVLLQQPKLGPYIHDIRASLAHVLFTDISQVSVKAKTGEQLGPVGEGKAIEAHAAILVHEADPAIWV